MSTVLSDLTHFGEWLESRESLPTGADAVRLVGERAHAAAALIQTGDTFDASSPAKISHPTCVNSL